MTTPANYEHCLEEMYQLRRFGIKLELDTIRTILNSLGRPQERFPSIHLAGTNGKGSIAAMLSTILHQAGYRVGRYTSPHLIRFNERITINNRPISDDRVVAAYEAVKGRHKLNRQPTFFEYTTAMAFHEFARQQVDLAVIETGMGGRFDATNVLQPDLCIISNISLEHQMYLGNTLAAITREKAGIIKQNTPVVTGVTQQQARDTITSTAEEQKAPLYMRNTHFKIRSNGIDGRFSYYGMKTRHKQLQLGLEGSHQKINAALVLAACELLNDRGWEISEKAVRQGLASTQWPARLEIVSRAPLILIDGAHNLMAARSLAGYMKNNLAGMKTTLIIGILDDKSHAAILKTLVPLCRTAIITRPRIDRGMAPEILKKEALRLTGTVKVIDTVEAAIDYALTGMPPTEALCIAGSLYVAGEARAALINKGFIATEAAAAVRMQPPI